jgi:hypothetical protein
MKCYDFLCKRHDPDFRCNSQKFILNCETRKRYNRIMSGERTEYSVFQRPIHVEDKLFLERNKYYGRNK